MRDDLLALVAVIAPLSLVAVGGASGMYAPLQHQTVDVYRWLTAREFLDLFALARVTPGPGSMITALIGWKVAGLPGALVATLALYIPACTACFLAAKVWNKYRGTHWHSAIETGLRPVAAGIIGAAVITLLRLAETGPVSWVVLGAASAIFILRPKVHPFLVLVAGAALYLAAWSAGLTAF
jgi:chromate transporter